MRHSKQTRDVDPHQPRLRNARRSDAAANPGVGDQFIGPSGRIWTIQSVVSTARRFVLTRPTDDGVAAAVVDLDALANMARLNSVNAAAPATGFSRGPSRPRLTAPTLSHGAVLCGSTLNGGRVIDRHMGWPRPNPLCVKWAVRARAFDPSGVGA